MNKHPAVPGSDNLPGSISAVIPNYNGQGLLEKNLPYLYDALELSGCVYEIILSDDCSTDDSIFFVRSNYPGIRILESERNTGFPVTINKGIFAAQFQLVLLLNTDIRLTRDFFKHQLTYFSLPDTFGVMGWIRREDSGETDESCKYPLAAFLRINRIKNIVPATGVNNAFTYYLSGANALVDREKLVSLGGFNELYAPFYHEDLDLSLRAWRSGWKCYYEHRAGCLHTVSSTIRKFNRARYIRKISTRNKMMLHYTHTNGIQLAMWFMTMIMSLLYRWLLGQSFYYGAIKLFFFKFSDIRQYKKAFEAMAVKRLSIDDIRSLVRKNLERKL